MIFGLDDRKNVYWFYPAWTNPADDPVAIPIETDGERHELPDAVRQPMSGRVEIHALFVDEPLSVKDVESSLRGDAAKSLGRGPAGVLGPNPIESTAVFTVGP
jgi:hypothetical protein